MPEENDQQPDKDEGAIKALRAERELRAASEKRAREAEAKVSEFERRDRVAAVAARKGIPGELASRLKGDTDAELESDADALLKVIKPEKPNSSTERPKESLRPGASSEGEPAENAAEIAAAILK